MKAIYDFVETTDFCEKKFQNIPKIVLMHLPSNFRTGVENPCII